MENVYYKIYKDLKRFAKNKRNRIERKVICISGSKEKLDDFVSRLRVSTGKRNIELVDERKKSKASFSDPTKKVYIFATSMLEPEQDKWISENHPGFVFILEDTRIFEGECERINLS